ncbi:hypothetical protein [Nonlabens ulvanivorans]|uniref:Uncharacterized protein n=1 Tax=Nonlabens ulvanivorans TaxID=906888 RepID=A0A090X411_NONUL|nr:hypothetical protein [Nonlabens ulvanivorans]PRX12134.1 hypothetical protein LY02_02814 [Nonlabens ulvanivorans]GAL76972.1 hypothetical protein JCM19275_3686 [Nonlabens ulvanivorans]
MKKGKEDKIPKPLLVINNFILVIGSIAVIVGLLLFVKYMIELDDKYNSNATALIHKNINNEVISCEIPNGTYKTIYDKQFSDYPEFIFEITDDSLFTEEQRFKIERSEYGTFSIEYPEINQDSLTDFQKTLHNYSKDNFYRITTCNGNYYKFENMVNLHITISTGTFIKLN